MAPALIWVARADGWLVGCVVMAFEFQAAYDELNPADDDYRFYADLAARLAAASVIDLGCGTGTLARLLAARGHRVVGIDPDPDMLRVAEGKGACGQIEWRLGYRDRADTGAADLFVMSGHVAQVFLDDEAWMQVLRDARRALRPGGTIAFESRNPAARGWERWTRDQTLRTVGSGGDRTEFWHETVDVRLPLVTFDTWTTNLTTGDRHRTRNTLAFRSLDALADSLAAAGFADATFLGDWDRSEVTAQSREIIVTARRPA